ncbi:hypothetical protein CERSUDRAFT_106649 [Gelatoporia subvermispora B]|uniref:Uncharacterized protein n=1 Tax=Ceriporiopsis subvermispora (strain B) TaxID=914234 RepID=M2RCG0_CERS8|nr:hypothetical protein CERSUDRAFT_106649 [Gelatoporia subvermispora B]
MSSKAPGGGPITVSKAFNHQYDEVHMPYEVGSALASYSSPAQALEPEIEFSSDIGLNWYRKLMFRVVRKDKLTKDGGEGVFERGEL